MFGIQDSHGVFYFLFVFSCYSDLAGLAVDFGCNVTSGAKLKIDHTKEFCPGSIHSEDVRNFWRTELKAGEWVMELLKEGYVIPFVEHPPAYEEANNKSAIQDITFVLQAVADLKKTRCY